jgi:hypothetical protein
MYLDWSMLSLLCLAGAIGWFWVDSLAARERANAAASAACEDLGLQLLDGTVAFARLSIRRGATGRIRLLRTYVFDYTANSIERRQGFVLMNGRRVDTVGYAQDGSPREIRRAEPRSAAETTEGGQVVQLEERRETRSIGTPPTGQERP